MKTKGKRKRWVVIQNVYRCYNLLNYINKKVIIIEVILSWHLNIGLCVCKFR